LLFDAVLQWCSTAEGLVKSEGFSNNASIIKADALRQRWVEGGETMD
jgi:hypothetical protein